MYTTRNLVCSVERILGQGKTSLHTHAVGKVILITKWKVDMHMAALAGETNEIWL